MKDRRKHAAFASASYYDPNWETGQGGTHGMSKLEYIATKCLQGLLTEPKAQDPKAAAEAALQYAHALIDAMDAEEQEEDARIRESLKKYRPIGQARANEQ